jgi:hypothetical protein
MTCPNCHQDAPSFVRGVRAHCSACGAPRSLVETGAALNASGQTAKVGGGVAGVIGWVALVIGLTVALILGAIVSVIAATAGMWVGGAIAFFTLAVSLPFILGGRRLRREGEGRARYAQEHAVFALAARQRGVLTARELARSLALREPEADALLTALAKRPDGRVTLEVDDDGSLSYVFHDLRPSAPRVRVREVDAPGVPVPPARIIDAELIEEQDALAVPRHASR